MKNNILYIFSCLFFLSQLLTSCTEEEIGVYMHDNDGEYLMSAIINTSDSLSHVSIRRVKKYISDPVNNAVVDILVNGKLQQSVAASDDHEGNYYFQPLFSADDEVEVVAHVGDVMLTSKSHCLAPVEIVSVDTTAYSVSYSDARVDNLYRVRIKIRKPQGAKRNGNFYRLDMRHTITLASIWTEYDYATHTYYLVRELVPHDEYRFSYKNDVALNNGNVNTDDDPLINFTDDTPNRYGVFTDDFFDGDTYTLVVDVPRNIFSWEEELQCVVSTISSDEYNYLKTVCVVSLDGADLFSGGTPVLKSNVSGGFGFVGVENASVYSIKWASHFDVTNFPYY